MTKFLDPDARRARMRHAIDKLGGSYAEATEKMKRFAEMMVNVAPVGRVESVNADGSVVMRFPLARVERGQLVACSEAKPDGGFELPIDKYMKDRPKCGNCGDSGEVVTVRGLRIPCPYCTPERP